MGMEFAERVLYHQIHPLKLLTDVSTAFIAAALLWAHRFGEAMIVGFVPAIVVSAMLLRWADFEPYRASRFGRYVSGFMTGASKRRGSLDFCRSGSARGIAPRS